MLRKDQVEPLSIEMERRKKLDRSLLEAIYEHRWFKLFVPEECGGRMTALPEAVQIFEEAARLDGNLGWLVAIGAGGGMFAGFMEPDTARTLFTPREAVIAGSGVPSGVARKTEGGYIVTGEWKYCSGASYATVFTAYCRIAGGEQAADGQPAVRACVFLPHQVEIIPDWNAVGLKATESHTIRVREAFVPDRMTFDLTERKGWDEHAIFRYPFEPFAVASFAAVVLGIARHFLEEAAVWAERNRHIWNAAIPHRHSFVLDKIALLEGQLGMAREKYRQAVRESWALTEKGAALTAEEGERVSRIGKQAARTAAACVQDLFPYLGMPAIMEDTLLNLIWRDLVTAAQHALLVSFEE